MPRDFEIHIHMRANFCFVPTLLLHSCETVDVAVGIILWSLLESGPSNKADLFEEVWTLYADSYCK